METMRAVTAYRLHGAQDRPPLNRYPDEMAATGALGVIKGIQSSLDSKEMLVYQDCLVVVSSGGGQMVARQFGLIGMLIYALGRKSREAAAERRRQQSAAELMALDPKSLQLMVRDIVDARLSAGMLNAKLTVSLVDGNSRKYSWAKKENEDGQVAGILRGALGTKLIDEKAAA
jgi:hypothetical protein